MNVCVLCIVYEGVCVCVCKCACVLCMSVCVSVLCVCTYCVCVRVYYVRECVVMSDVCGPNSRTTVFSSSCFCFNSARISSSSSSGCNWGQNTKVTQA